MWQIGIYKGNSVENLTPIAQNPIINNTMVKEFDAEFVADPFMIYVNKQWYLFFEALDKSNNKGVIGVSSSKNLIDWNYLGIALKEDFHLSYPFVFEHEGKIYMSPETLGANGVTLYEAVDFPMKWKPIKKLVEGQHADPTIILHNGLWWLFTCQTPYQYDSLSIFWSENLLGTWKSHNQNPIYTHEKSQSRPGGRVFYHNGNLYRAFQNCQNIYGEFVGLSKIKKLTVNEFNEEIISKEFLGPSSTGWNKERMHHLDCHVLPNNDIVACTDGFARK